MAVGGVSTSSLWNCAAVSSEPPSQTARSNQPLAQVSEHTTKESVVTITRSDVGLLDRYVKSREQARADAQPTFEYVDGDVCRQSDDLKARLSALEPGHALAGDYQQLVLEILNFLFNPELIDGRLEVRTADGTERRDIVFTNDSDESFWDFTRTEHSSLLLMFEAKNVSALDMTALNQTATYLGDRLGTLAFIVTRHDPGAAIQKRLTRFGMTQPQSERPSCSLRIDT